MGLPPGVTLERVEDAELRRSDADRVPRDRVWLFLNQGQRALQECGDLVFLARLRFHASKDPHLHHVRPPSSGERVSPSTRAPHSEYADRSIRVATTASVVMHDRLLVQGRAKETTL